MGGKITASGRGTTTSYGWLSYYLMWLWPGLPPLWVGGRWWGFALAVGFGLVGQLWLVSAVVWNEMLDPVGVRGLGVIWIGAWVIGIATNRRWLSRYRHPVIDEADGDLFPSALTEYLQGNWFAAEQKCRDLIARRRDDVEARLLLATTFRQVGRTAEARAELDGLAKIEGSAKWTLEIADERLRLEEESDETDEAENSEPEMIRRAA